MKLRKIFHTLKEELCNNKILLLVGPRQVGKTTLLKQLQTTITDKQTFFINLESNKYKLQLDQDPENIFLITGIDRYKEQIIFIDEIQYLADPTNFLKLLYDEYHQNMKLVVSGSSNFYIDRKFKDSLMGRKELYEIVTLDFEEFLDFRAEDTLKEFIVESKKIPLGYQSRINELFLEYITYGGYPEVVLQSDKAKKIRTLHQLANDYIKKDMYDANITEIDKFFSLLRVISSQIGELVNINELSSTLAIDQKTLEKYLYVMRKTYCVALIKPFWTNVRAEIIKMPKVFFFDLGLRNALLDNFDNISERFDKGQYFENIVWRELYLHYGVDKIKYWRTKNKNEVDFIVANKRAYEAKFHKNLIKESKYNLFRQKYPHIPLAFISFDDIVEQIIMRRWRDWTLQEHHRGGCRRGLE